jgi:hypothetical protein
MKLLNLQTLRSCGIQFILAAASLVLAGCSSSSPNAAAPPAASPSPESKAGAKSGPALAANTPAASSVFTISKDSRDPFFPKAKRAMEVAEPATQQPVSAIDILALLRQGFQGVIGSGETRIALINNVMLEPGRQTVIPIAAAGQSRSVAVRCREVTKDAVVLELQGYPQPVKIAKAN